MAAPSDGSPPHPPAPALCPAQHQTCQPADEAEPERRVTSHSWDDARPTPAAKVPAQPAERADVIQHLDRLSQGLAPPAAPRADPVGASEAWGSPRRLRVLLLFSGPCEHETALPKLLREAGCAVLAMDTKLMGAAHDVLRASVAEPLIHRVRAAEFDAVFLATPCSSYSVRHEPTLRSRDEPEGVTPMPPEWAAYVRKHNDLADVSARVIDACRMSATPVGIENPADRADPRSPARWDAYPNHGSLWRMPCIATALGAYHASFSTFAQCSFASAAQKWTTIAAAGGLQTPLAALGAGRYGCAHGSEAHAEQLTGRDETGASRAGRAAAYPAALNRLLASALVDAATGRRRRLEQQTPAAALESTAAARLPPIREGRVADGQALGPVADAACEAARTLPTRFAHASARTAATAHELYEMEFPSGPGDTAPSSRPAGTCKARRRRPLPRHKRMCAWTGCCADPQSPPAPPSTAGVAIAALFLPGVYEGEVLSWLALADTAAAAIRAGRKPPPVPTRVIGQDQLQPWARGIVWDCRDPASCTPVKRSTRHTAFPGKRQIDRAAMRRIAAALGWHDDDIVDQIGEGGVEVRSECSMDIVLAFHHDSLLQEIPMAEAAVRQHVEEQWVAPPVRHLPFVPCRLQPRGVIMQPRSRLMPDGVTLEEYDKPRITTDSSFGGVDSVNAGVADRDRTVRLPSAQALGRAWGICNAALREDASSAQGYCVDAESAYSFCPIQVADLWTQCFVWWDEEGTAGVAVDERMGFGGAFAPNRFVRTSALVAAFAQHLQAQFDAAQPPPAAAQRFTAHRRELQSLGRLPPGEAQLHARYLQVFVDDFTGVAGDDVVAVPANVKDIHLETRHMVAAGCVPARPDTRVHVHARLTVLALRMCGLHAAPHKVVCGSPLPALGLLLDGGADRLVCPEGKRAAVLADVASQRTRATSDGRVDRGRARRLVGRLCNLSQVAPEIRAALHGGYTITEALWPGGGGRCHGSMRIREGSPAHRGWLELLDVAEAALSANLGVCLAPRVVALPRLTPGTLTSVTDASGEDGFGGYVFSPDRPGEVFLVSEEWPPEAKMALAAAASETQAALRRRGSDEQAAHLSMPAAELFAALAVPLAVARSVTCHTVFAVGDCAPAAGAVDAMHSRTPQVRSIVAEASATGWSWVSAKVPREANLDADRLSHPALLEAVRKEAKEAGLVAHVVRLTGQEWRILTAAVASTGVGRGTKRPRP